jgi:hypothetical protein
LMLTGSAFFEANQTSIRITTTRIIQTRMFMFRILGGAAVFGG